METKKVNNPQNDKNIKNSGSKKSRVFAVPKVSVNIGFTLMTNVSMNIVLNVRQIPLSSHNSQDFDFVVISVLSIDIAVLNFYNPVEGRYIINCNGNKTFLKER